MREPSDAHKRQLEVLLNDRAGYAWTGYPGSAYGVEWIWELQLYWIDDRWLTMVDALLGEYYVDL